MTVGPRRRRARRSPVLALTLAAHLVYGYVTGSTYDRFVHPIEWSV